MLPTNAEMLTKEITAVSVVETSWEHINRSNVLKLELFIFVSGARSRSMIRSQLNAMPVLFEMKEEIASRNRSPPASNVVVGKHYKINRIKVASLKINYLFHKLQLRTVS